MSQLSDHESSEWSEPKAFAGNGSHRGLVLGAALLASGAAVVAGVYGLSVRWFVFQALALDGAMIALGAWLVLHALRIRGRLAEAEEWEPQAWEDVDEEQVNVTLEDVHHARNVHYLVLAAPATVVLGVLAGLLLWNPPVPDPKVLDAQHRAAASVICLIACCLWLILSKSFEAIGKMDLPEGRALMLAFREIQWATLLVAAGILGANLWPKGKPWPPETWVAGVILVWLLATCVEQLIRVVAEWLRRAPVEEGFQSPVYLLAREAVFVRGNPIASLFETIEARFGVSFRSSWAIQFVRRAAVPSLVAVLLMFWGLTCLSVVPTDELGVRESFGRIQASPLPPGLHWKLPWPFGRMLHYPVKQVSTMSAGFVAGPTRQRAYLWTKAHAAEEHPFVLGENGTEAVCVGAVVYYKISEDPKGFLDYVYKWSRLPAEEVEGPRLAAEAEEALRAFAYRALMEQTRSRTLQDVLAANREEFADRLEESLRRYSEENRLGLEIINVVFLTVHPPIEVAAEYLDVINAEIDADRALIEAEGQREANLTIAETVRGSMVAQAEAEAADRIGDTVEQSARFLAVREAYSAASEAFKLRLWFETLERALGVPPKPIRETVASEGTQSEKKQQQQPEKRLIVVDKSFADGAGLLIDLRRKAPEENVVPSGVQ